MWPSQFSRNITVDIYPMGTYPPRWILGVPKTHPGGNPRSHWAVREGCGCWVNITHPSIYSRHRYLRNTLRCNMWRGMERSIRQPDVRSIPVRYRRWEDMVSLLILFCFVFFLFWKGGGDYELAKPAQFPPFVINVESFIVLLNG